MASVESLKKHFAKVIAQKAALMAVTTDSDYFPPEMVAEMRSLIEPMNTTPAYKKHMENVGGQFFQWLEDSGALDDMDRAPVSAYAQCGFLQDCADKLSELMSGCGVQVSRPAVQIYKDTGPNAIAGNTVCYPLALNPNPEFIRLNSFEKIALRDENGENIKDEQGNDILIDREVSKRDAVLTICHEMTHFFNMSLSRAYANELLNEGDTLFEDGKYFREMVRMNDNNQNGYICSAFGPLYKLQLDERCAYGFGDTMRGLIDAALRNRTPDFVRDIHPAAIRQAAPASRPLIPA